MNQNNEHGYEEYINNTVIPYTTNRLQINSDQLTVFSNVNHQNSDIIFIKKKYGRNNPWGPYTYVDLITQAITSSQNKRLTILGIYNWLTDNVEYFKKYKDSCSGTSGWKNSVRHNLSYHKRFIRCNGVKGLRNSWWMLSSDSRLKKANIQKASTSEDNNTFESQLISLEPNINMMNRTKTVPMEHSGRSTIKNNLDYNAFPNNVLKPNNESWYKTNVNKSSGLFNIPNEVTSIEQVSEIQSSYFYNCQKLSSTINHTQPSNNLEYKHIRNQYTTVDTSEQFAPRPSMYNNQRESFMIRNNEKVAYLQPIYNQQRQSCRIDNYQHSWQKKINVQPCVSASDAMRDIRLEYQAQNQPYSVDKSQSIQANIDSMQISAIAHQLQMSIPQATFNGSTSDQTNYYTAFAADKTLQSIANQQIIYSNTNNTGNHETPENKWNQTDIELDLIQDYINKDNWNRTNLELDIIQEFIDQKEAEEPSLRKR